MVALARKLLVAWWCYLETGAVPEGAITLDGKEKKKGPRPAAARA